jgi:hypothetical protein
MATTHDADFAIDRVRRSEYGTLLCLLAAFVLEILPSALALLAFLLKQLFPVLGFDALDTFPFGLFDLSRNVQCERHRHKRQRRKFTFSESVGRIFKLSGIKGLSPTASFFSDPASFLRRMS